jgi:hypothetical protein
MLKILWMFNLWDKHNGGLIDTFWHLPAIQKIQNCTSDA